MYRYVYQFHMSHKNGSHMKDWVTLKIHAMIWVELWYIVLCETLSFYMLRLGKPSNPLLERQEQVENHIFKSSLGFQINFRPAWAIEWTPISKQQVQKFYRPLCHTLNIYHACFDKIPNVVFSFYTKGIYKTNEPYFKSIHYFHTSPVWPEIFKLFSCHI